MHRFKADESYLIGEGKGPAALIWTSQESSRSREKGVDMIHPGYGFLSENADFAEACVEAGIAWVGPRPELLKLMGDKVAARALAQKVGVPTLPGTEEPVEDAYGGVEDREGDRFSADHQGGVGGGGRGMRVVTRRPTWRIARRGAERGGACIRQSGGVSREIYSAREAHRSSGLGDHHGNLLHLHRDFQIRQIIQRIENAEDIDARFRRVLHESGDDVVRIIGIADRVRAAEKHLKTDVRNFLAQQAQPLPRIFVQKPHRRVERRAAPHLQAENSGVRRATASATASMSKVRTRVAMQRLMRVAKSRVGDEQPLLLERPFREFLRAEFEQQLPRAVRRRVLLIVARERRGVATVAFGCNPWPAGCR